MWPYQHDVFYGFGTVLSIGIEVAVIVTVIVVILRIAGFGGRHHMRRGWSAPWEGRDALDILKERYAKGEINKEEYEEKKKVLSEDRQ